MSEFIVVERNGLCLMLLSIPIIHIFLLKFVEMSIFIWIWRHSWKTLRIILPVGCRILKLVLCSIFFIYLLEIVKDFLIQIMSLQLQVLIIISGHLTWEVSCWLTGGFWSDLSLILTEIARDLSSLKARMYALILFLRFFIFLW